MRSGTLSENRPDPSRPLMADPGGDEEDPPDGETTADPGGDSDPDANEGFEPKTD